MKKLYTGIILLFLAGLVLAVNWIPQGAVIGTRGQGEAALTAVSEGDLFVYDDTELNGDLTVTGNATITGTLTATGVQTFTAAPVSSATKYGYGPRLSSTIYTVEIATTIAANGTYLFTDSDGKAGCYTILAGTHSAVGTFTSAAAISINVAGTSADSTAIAVTDGGSACLLTNGEKITKTYMITVKFVN
jgi:hypothetical protein